MRELAILTESPAFTEPLHVGRPNIANPERFMQRTAEILESRWLTNNGPFVQEFEQLVAEVAGIRHCVAMCNATVALEMAVRALKLSGEVIVPSYTFIATAHALQWQEITPVFADIDPNSHTLDPQTVERMITPKTTGIIGVHTWGHVCDVEGLQAVADRRGIALLFDAAHAFGCSRGGRRVGGFGRCEVFSFHATKFINSFEGGAVVTNDDDLAAKLRLMRNFGFDGYDRVTYLGVNGKMTEVCAAMGVTSLEGMEEIIAINRRNYEAYRRGLAGLPGISLIAYDDAERNNYHYIVAEANPGACPLTRDELVATLHAENILARKYFWPGCHRMEPYRSLQPNAYLLLTETERIAARVMVLPTGECVSVEMIALVCNIIRRALEQAGEVRRVLNLKSRHGEVAAASSCAKAMSV